MPAHRGAAGVSETHAFEPDLVKWDAWRPQDVARRLADVDVPWYVAAGWAIDLFLGEERREHEDLEIAVPRDRLGQVLAVFDDHELFAAGVPGPDLVTPLAHVDETCRSYHQTWVRERGSGRWRLDIFREPADGDVWICRRDPSIRLPYERVIERTSDGIPYGAPEIVLLFKAKHSRAKDDGDLAAVLPRLALARRRWLAAALARVHPGHRWLDACGLAPR